MKVLTEASIMNIQKCHEKSSFESPRSQISISPHVLIFLA
jgi:hypothetical protein